MNPGLVVSLIFTPGVGWGYSVVVNGRPLPADDPLDATSVSDAYRAALARLDAALDQVETPRSLTAQTRCNPPTGPKPVNPRRFDPYQPART